MYSLHTLKPGPNSKRKHRRIGRGHGSGRGKTAGRGTKGQKARSGGRGGLKRLGMKRMLLQQPKVRGFKSIHPKPESVNIGTVAGCITVGTMVTPKSLAAAGLIPHARNGAKILGGGSCTKQLTFKDVEVSAGAKAKIEQAGGTIIARDASS
ncbi:MAG: 50S ribosomal protein L15 [bacterium]|nr:50S ribosomal protein L15 [bacterium]